jgi:hypothetical protein
MSKYNSPFSIGKRKTIFIDPEDPRVKNLKYGITESRIGSEIKIVDANGLSQAGQLSYLKGRGPSSPIVKKPGDPNEGVKPGSITNLAAEWEGTTLVITFDFDFSAENNKNVQGFQYYLTPTGFPKSSPISSNDLNKTSVNQIINFTESKQYPVFNTFHGSFDLLEIAAYDSFGNLGDFATLDMTGIVYVPDLCVPIITATPLLKGYQVNFTEVCEKPFEFVSVEEIVSSAPTAPASGYIQVYLDSIRPARVLAETTEARWVKARYTDNVGKYGPYSNAVQVTPLGIQADLQCPGVVTSITGVGASNTADPSGISGILTLTLTNPTYESDFAGYAVKIVNSGRTWYQTFPTTTALTTLVVNNGILTGQSYTISVASYDSAGNYCAYTNATGNPILVSDTRVNTSVVTNLAVSVTDSIGTASWTAPNDSQVGSYKVMVTSNADTGFATPLQTIYTDSTQTSFGGLSPSTTYRIRVITQYTNNGPLSTNNVTTTFTLNSAGSISDGVAPTTNPTITTSNIKSLFGAFAITFPAISNTDAVIYEVFIKPTNSTGIIDGPLTYKVLEVGGTFAVVKTLADKTTALSYGTDYYIAIRAKDIDGVSTGTVTPVGPVQTLQVQNADLAADSVYANNIKAGEIDASKMITDLLFTNKTINVGESTSLNRIRLDANTATISGQSVKSRIFIGAGNYDDAGTSFYADNIGRVSIKDKLKFDGTNLQIDANGSFGGLLTAGPAGQSIKIGLNAGGSGLNGIYIESTGDYIYSNGTVRLGAGKITYNGTLLSIQSQVEITGASTVTGNLSITGTNSSLIVGNGTTNSVIIKNGASGLGGLAAFDGDGAAMTEILNTPIESGGQTPGGNPAGTWTDATGQKVNFFTKGALIGGWLITSTLIRDKSKQFVLDSTNKLLQITGTESTTNYYVKLSTSSSNIYSSTVNVFEAGTVGQKPGVYITYDGNLNAQNASLQGLLSTNTSGTVMKFGRAAGGVVDSTDGLHLNSTNYWYATGNFSVAGIITGTASSVVFELNNGSNNITFNNMPASDFGATGNGWAGDPTVTIDDVSKKLVKGRRFIYQSLYTGANGPGSVIGFNSTTKEGTYETGDGFKTIKSGDIVFIQEA